MRGRHFLTALGLNAVPAAGWFAGDWSPGTTLLLYWLETLLATLLLTARISLHRRLSPSRGHWEYQAPPRHDAKGRRVYGGNGSTFLVSFLVPSLVFTAAHGVFLFAFGGLVLARSLTPDRIVDPENLLTGLAGIAFFQVLDFLLDLHGLRERPFHWIERLSLLNMARVVLIHLAIIGGMGAAVFFGTRAFFSVFIGLKTLWDCGSCLPPWKPGTPPRWFSAIMNRIKGPNDDGTTFEEFYAQGDDEKVARRERNERPFARTQAG
jgi:hypothetical protein